MLQRLKQAWREFKHSPSGCRFSGALSETAAVLPWRCEKGLLHRRRASHHRGRGRLLPCPRRPERADHCRGSRNIRTGIHARRAASRLDRATSARPDALDSEDLEALAPHGEGPDRRSLDGVAGDGVGMASIACSFVSSILNIPTCLTPATGDAAPKMQD